MPLTGIRGDTGSGKTLLAMYYMKRYFSKIEKFGNFPTELNNWHEIDMLGLTELPETDRMRIVIRDEGYTDFDNRRSMDEEQIFNTYALMQHRKSNMSMVGITQLDMMDLRWRGLEKFTILCKDRPIYVKKGDEFIDYKGDFHYVFIHGSKVHKFTMPYKTALKLFPIYKSKYKILPNNYESMKTKIRMKNPKERNKVVDNIVSKIVKECSIPTDKKNITHDWVKNELMNLEQDLSLEPYVYIRLRNRV